MKKESKLTESQKEYYREYNKKWRKLNPEKTKEYKKRDRIKNKIKIRKRWLDWQRKNRLKVNIWKKRWYNSGGKMKHKISYKKYLKTEKGKAMKKRNNIKYRKKLLNLKP